MSLAMSFRQPLAFYLTILGWQILPHLSVFTFQASFAHVRDNQRPNHRDAEGLTNSSKGAGFVDEDVQMPILPISFRARLVALSYAPWQTGQRGRL